MLRAIGRSAVKKSEGGGTEVFDFEIHRRLVTLGWSVSLLMIKQVSERQRTCTVSHSGSLELDGGGFKGTRELILAFVTMLQSLKMIATPRRVLAVILILISEKDIFKDSDEGQLKRKKTAKLKSQIQLLLV